MDNYTPIIDEKTNEGFFNRLKDEFIDRPPFCYYRGPFSNNLVNRLINVAKNHLNYANENVLIKKRVYYLIIETLQNVIRHMDHPKAVTKANEPMTLLHKDSNAYYITTGNPVLNEKLPDLLRRLKEVNSTDKKGLKTLYMRQLKQGSISEKGGAGLGMIDMAKRSGRKINFKLVELNDVMSYFFFQIQVPLHEADFPDDMGVELLFSIKMHEIFKIRNIVLAYIGGIHLNNLIELLEMIENSIVVNESFKVQKGVYNTSMELLQNNLRIQQAQIKEGLSRYGLFGLVKESDQYVVTSGSELKPELYDFLKEKIDFVNSKETRELKKELGLLLMKEIQDIPDQILISLMEMKIKGNCVLDILTEHKSESEYSGLIHAKVNRNVN